MIAGLYKKTLLPSISFKLAEQSTEQPDPSKG